MLQPGATVPVDSEAWQGLGAVRAAGPRRSWGTGGGKSASLPLPTFCPLLQLDSEDAEPNFDEDGQDEYNELHMPV